MTLPYAAPPISATASFFVDPRGNHTVVKLHGADLEQPAFAHHLIADRQLSPADGITWLAEQGWTARDDDIPSSDGVWVVAVYRADNVAADDAAEVRHYERMRADVVHRQGRDGADFLVQYLADRGDLPGSVGTELARLIVEAREGDDPADDQDWEDRYDPEYR
jgi:hypothetical protein